MRGDLAQLVACPPMVWMVIIVQVLAPTNVSLELKLFELSTDVKNIIVHMFHKRFAASNHFNFSQCVKDCLKIDLSTISNLD
jgi:hypothetical protein